MKTQQEPSGGARGDIQAGSTLGANGQRRLRPRAKVAPPPGLTRRRRRGGRVSRPRSLDPAWFGPTGEGKTGSDEPRWAGGFTARRLMPWKEIEWRRRHSAAPERPFRFCGALLLPPLADRARRGAALRTSPLRVHSRTQQTPLRSRLASAAPPGSDATRQQTPQASAVGAAGPAGAPFWRVSAQRLRGEAAVAAAPRRAVWTEGDPGGFPCPSQPRD